MSRRTQKVAHTLREAVEEVLLRGLADPRVRGLVSVTGVDLTEDLLEATVRVSVFPAEHQDQTLEGLRAASGHIRRLAAQRLVLRAMPQLRFVLDLSLKRQAEVLAAIDKARASDEAHRCSAQAGAAPAAPPGEEPGGAA